MFNKYNFQISFFMAIIIKLDKINIRLFFNVLRFIKPQ